jgi:hypothetical protein
LQHSIPLPVIFCRPERAKPSVGALDTLARFIWAEREPENEAAQGLGDLHDPPSIHRGVPSHIETFLQAARSERGQLTQAWFRDFFYGVEAVFVTDLRLEP